MRPQPGQRRGEGVVQLAAENIAWGYRDITQAMAGWTSSPEHVAVLLVPRARDFGVALAMSARTRYWVLVLAGPC